MDVRALRTKESIREAFFSLLAEKNLGRITVTELIKRAGINRSTFYKHYLDIPDLMEKTEEQMLLFLREQVEGWTDYRSYKASLVALLNALQEKKMIWQLICGPHGDPLFVGRCLQVLYEETKGHLEASSYGLGEGERQIHFHYMANGCMGVLQAWFQDGMTYPAEDLVDELIALVKKTMG